MTIKHRYLLPLAASILIPAAASQAAATFSLDDGTGAPASGTYTPGSSFNLAVTFTSTVATTGYSLWFDTATGNTSYFSIGSFTLTSGSPFSAGSGGGMGAQAFDTMNSMRPGFQSNLMDLGATTPNGSGVAANSYLVETVNFVIDSSVPSGTYTIQTTPPASGGRASGSADADANFTFEQAPSATYTITIPSATVPEPTTWALMAVGATVLAGSRQLRRRRA